MSYLRFILIIVLVTLPFAYYSCDDSGVVPPFVPKGLITFTHFGLKPLERTVDGYYQLWVRKDSSGIHYYSLGEFNIAGDGTIIDLQFQPMRFKLPPDLDTNSLNTLTHAIVTVETQNVVEPSNRRLISCELSKNDDSLYGGLAISGSEALGNIGNRLLTLGPGENYGKFIFYTPSNNTSTCKQGAWFCDSNFSSGIPTGLNLPTNSGWVYEGWIIDQQNLVDIKFYSLGRFYNPYTADLDGAGPCAGPNPGLNVPGQDFILKTTSCPSITDLANGKYGIMITLEPSTEINGQNRPFFLRLFLQDYLPNSIGCKRTAYVYRKNEYPLPTGRIKITN